MEKLKSGIIYEENKENLFSKVLEDGIDLCLSRINGLLPLRLREYIKSGREI